MFADYNDAATLASFATAACPGYVNIHSIHPQTDRLFATETLCGDYSGRLLILAQDLTTATRIRDRKAKDPNKNPFWHRPDNKTNLTLVSMLRHVGQLAEVSDLPRAHKLVKIDADGTNARDCGVVYGSIVWLLKDTKSVSSALPNLKQALEASKGVIRCAIRSMPNLDRIICLGSKAYEGLAWMYGQPAGWRSDLTAHKHFTIERQEGRSIRAFPTSHLGGIGLAGRSQFPDARNGKALEACRADFKRALEPTGSD